MFDWPLVINYHVPACFRLTVDIPFSFTSVFSFDRWYSILIYKRVFAWPLVFHSHLQACFRLTVGVPFSFTSVFSLDRWCSILIYKRVFVWPLVFHSHVSTSFYFPLVIPFNNGLILSISVCFTYDNHPIINKGNNKITELRTIFQRESQNS
jgi:hypothetical protein